MHRDAVQLKDLVRQDRVCLHFALGDKPRWPSGQRHYLCTLEMAGRFLSTDYFTNGTPTREGVLGCLLSDCTEDSFEDWCSNYGYDTDSRKAFATWEACRATMPKVRAFLGDKFDEYRAAEW